MRAGPTTLSSADVSTRFTRLSAPLGRPSVRYSREHAASRRPRRRLDASIASYFLGAAAITGGNITVEGLGTGSLKGDVAFAYVHERMGS